MKHQEEATGTTGVVLFLMMCAKNITYMTEIALSFLLDRKFKKYRYRPYTLNGKKVCFCRYPKTSNIISIIIYGSDEMTKISSSILLNENITILSFSSQQLYPQLENPYYIHAGNILSWESELHYFINHFHWKYIGIIHVGDDKKRVRKTHAFWNELLTL